MKLHIPILLRNYGLDQSQLNQHLLSLCAASDISFDSVNCLPIRDSTVALNQILLSSDDLHDYISSQGKLFRCLSGKKYSYRSVEVLQIVSQAVVDPEDEEIVDSVQPAIDQIRMFTGRVDSAMMIDQDVEENPLSPICRTSSFVRPLESSSKRSLFSPIPEASTHYGLIGNDSNDQPVYLNTEDPFAIVLFGNQGSGILPEYLHLLGKSHSVSTILENCLLDSPPNSSASPPLKPIVFHYDQASSNLCEVNF
jgi:hypothetical protein